MAHSYVSNLTHYVFSTKNRERSITVEIEERLWGYLGGIARERRIKPICIGGVEDHLHMLVSIPATLSVSKSIQLIKGGSSKWVHDTFPNHPRFEWQEGYGAFSVGISDLNRSVRYINNQKTHHKRVSFKEEFIAFLKKHEIEYVERYIWADSAVPTGLILL